MGVICSNPWTTLFVWGTGDVTHCCYSNAGPLGNIRRQSWESIWRGRRLQRIRERMQRGDFERAGCEPFCRVYRWQRFYGDVAEPPAIPRGLGRGAPPHFDAPLPRPTTLGIAIPWRCNLRCQHCLAIRGSPGLSPVERERLLPLIGDAETLRLMNGELSVNDEALRFVHELSQRPQQPRLFSSSNGQVPVSSYLAEVAGIRAFHLKLSLEGTGRAYEEIRTGGSWRRFVATLAEATDLFAVQRRAGRDWQLYLNFCVMRRNYESIPEVLRLAADHGLPIVLNTINGARHIRENPFIYSELRPSLATRRRVVEESLALMAVRRYPFAKDVAVHLDYLERCFDDRMLEGRLLGRVATTTSWSPGVRSGQGLYLLYRFRLSKRAAVRLLRRKLATRLGRIVQPWVSSWRAKAARRIAAMRAS